jgi:outer membrane protein assembly factor BamD (BamD/ComL family)
VQTKTDDEPKPWYDPSNLKAPWNWDLFKPKPPPGPADSLVLRGDQLEAEKAGVEGKAAEELAGAHELYRRGDYAGARKLFRSVADNTKNAAAVAEEARFYEAECLRQQSYYPAAADTYVQMLNDFPSGAYREQAVQHIFDIANYWLDDTRKEMQQVKERREGKRWFVDQEFVHWDRTKPFLDEEGHAIEKLEQVHYNDITGPMADKALFLMGSVRFFDEDYKEADHYFSQLVEMHPNSKLAPQAVELAIIAKELSPGGSDYDGRKVAEARKLVHAALGNYPELASKKSEFLERQLIAITIQQAETDYKRAQFYERIGHPEPAYFYYEMVRRRYPGTKYAELATKRKGELEEQARKDGKPLPAPMPAKPPANGSRPAKPQAPPETAPPPRPLPPGLETAPPPRPVSPTGS